MNELIKIIEKDGQRAVSARELHQFLEVQSKFIDWFNRRIDEYGFIEGEDYQEVFLKNEKNDNGGRPSKEYALTLDMAKELSMVEKTEKGKQARRYFIEMEKIALQGKLLPSNKNKDLQLELFDLIRANLLKGDLAAVAKEYGFNKNTVKVYCTIIPITLNSTSPLSQSHYSIKTKLRHELETMIYELKR